MMVDTLLADVVVVVEIGTGRNNRASHWGTSLYLEASVLFVPSKPPSRRALALLRNLLSRFDPECQRFGNNRILCHLLSV